MHIFDNSIWRKHIHNSIKRRSLCRLYSYKYIKKTLVIILSFQHISIICFKRPLHFNGIVNLFPFTTDCRMSSLVRPLPSQGTSCVANSHIITPYENTSPFSFLSFTLSSVRYSGAAQRILPSIETADSLAVEFSFVLESPKSLIFA